MTSKRKLLTLGLSALGLAIAGLVLSWPHLQRWMKPPLPGLADGDVASILDALHLPTTLRPKAMYAMLCYEGSRGTIRVRFRVSRRQWDQIIGVDWIRSRRLQPQDFRNKPVFSPECYGVKWWNPILPLRRPDIPFQVVLPKPDGGMISGFGRELGADIDVHAARSGSFAYLGDAADILLNGREVDPGGPALMLPRMRVRERGYGDLSVPASKATRGDKAT